MSGAIIYRSRIMDKTGAMNRELTNMEEAVQAQKNNMLLVNEQKSLLCGTSWDSARSYIEEIQIPLLNVTLQYLKAQKEGNHAYQNAAMRLPSVNVLDEDKLEQEQDYWNNRLNREYPRGSVIRRCRNAIREIDSKLLAIRVFASGTNRVYDRAEEPLSALNQADTQLNKVSYHPQTNVIDYTMIDPKWLLEMGEASAKQYLLEKGLAEKDIKRLQKLGFSSSKAKLIYEMAETEEDKILIDGLMRGEYEKAFQAKAREITMPTQLFLSEYVLQIALGGSDKELEGVINAILKQYWDTSYQGMGGNIDSNANTMKYLELLYAGTITTLDLESVLFLNPDSLSKETHETLLKRNEKMMGIATMYGSMYESLGERMKTGGTTCDMSSILMSDLVYAVNTDSYEYHISYEGFSGFATPTWSSPELITGSFSVDTQILWHPDGIGGQLYIESYDKLLKKQEELKKKLLLEVLEGGVVTGLTVVNPFAGAGASLVFAAAKESSGDAAIATHSIVSESDFTKNQKMNGVLESKTATISANAVKAWLDYQQANSNITSELARLENERRMNWFGQGGTYAAGGEKPKLVVSGIYNPEVIEKIGIWENQGLKGLLNESGVELPKDTAINEETGFLKSLTEAEKKFWNGEGILAMSAKELEEYSRAVSDKYQKAFENQINIQDLLNPKMGETDHE